MEWLPLWSCIIRDKFGFRRCPGSSAHVEAAFGSIKRQSPQTWIHRYGRTSSLEFTKSILTVLQNDRRQRQSDDCPWLRIKSRGMQRKQWRRWSRRRSLRNNQHHGTLQRTKLHRLSYLQKWSHAWRSTQLHGNNRFVYTISYLFEFFEIINFLSVLISTFIVDIHQYLVCYYIYKIYMRQFSVENFYDDAAKHVREIIKIEKSFFMKKHL